MNAAYEEAIKALEMNETPIGAIVVMNSGIIGRGHNMREHKGDVMAHAEIAALKMASSFLGDWRLSACDVYVTLEPCPMCAGALIASRVRRLYFGAYDTLYGAAGGSIDLFKMLKSATEIYGGIMEERCSSLLTDFFATRRNGGMR